jgi:membrane protein DedA with SNARE-associated domain
MKDNLSIAIMVIILFLIGYGAYEIVTEENNYDGGQGYWILGIGIFMAIVLFFFKKNDKPGR